jgi:hypothetical protein
MTIFEAFLAFLLCATIIIPLHIIASSIAHERKDKP